MQDHDKNQVIPPVADEAEYSAPRIESVITPADLEREVHYAGQDGISVER